MPLEERVLKAGGGHVVNNTPLPNARAEEQLLARVARNGEPGTGISILLRSDIAKVLKMDEAELTDEILKEWRDRRDKLVEKRNKSFLEDRLPQTLFRGELYKKMCNKMAEVREMCQDEKEMYAKSQFQEHWAFWIAKTSLKITEAIEQGKANQKRGNAVIEQLRGPITTEFNSFLATKTQQLKEFIKNPIKLGFFTNPAYVVQTARILIHSDPGTAEQLLTHAFEMDPQFGAYALYYRALAYINQGYALFEKKNKRTSANDKLHDNAKRDLKEAKRIADDMFHYISGIQVISGDRPECQLQYTRELELISCFIYECNKALSRIEECDQNQKQCVVHFINAVPIEESFRLYNEERAKQQKEEEEKKKNDANGQQSSSDDQKMESDAANGDDGSKNNGPDGAGPSPPNPYPGDSSQPEKANDNTIIDEAVIPHDQIRNMTEVGMKDYFRLGIAAPKPPRFLLLKLFVLAAIQCVAGLFLCSTGGWSLIQGGLNDFATIIKRCWNNFRGKAAEPFTWAAYFAKKAIHYLKAFLGFCLNALANKIPAIGKFNSFFGINAAAPTITNPTEMVNMVVTKTFTPQNIICFTGERIMDVAVDEKKHPKLRGALSTVLNTSIGVCSDTVQFAKVNKDLLQQKYAGHALNFFGGKVRSEVMKVVHEKVQECNFDADFLGQLAKEGIQEVSNDVTGIVIQHGTEFVDGIITNHLKNTKPEYKSLMEFVEECKKESLTTDQVFQIAKNAKKNATNGMPSKEEFQNELNKFKADLVQKERHKREKMEKKKQKQQKKREKQEEAEQKRQQKQQKSEQKQREKQQKDEDDGPNDDDDGNGNGPADGGNTADDTNEAQSDTPVEVIEIYCVGVRAFIDACNKQMEDRANIQNLHMTSGQLNSLYKIGNDIRMELSTTLLSAQTIADDKPGCSQTSGTTGEQQPKVGANPILFVPKEINDFLELLKQGESPVRKGLLKDSYDAVIGCYNKKVNAATTIILKEIYGVESIRQLDIAQVMDFQKKFLGSYSLNHEDLPKTILKELIDKGKLRPPEAKDILKRLVREGKLTEDLYKAVWTPTEEGANGKTAFSSKACGAYQFTPATLRDLIKNAPFDVKKMKFSEEIQDWLAYQLMKTEKLQAFLDGIISAEDFHNRLARRWASIPVSKDMVERDLKAGDSYYKGVGPNVAHPDLSFAKLARVYEGIKMLSKEQKQKQTAAQTRPTGTAHFKFVNTKSAPSGQRI